MPFPVAVTFRDMPASESLEAFIQKWAARLERVEPRIQHCDVTVDMPHRHHERGNRFRVQVVISVPGHDVAVSHDPGVDDAHEDAQVAVRDSFRAARRILEEQARKLRSHRVALA